MRAQEGICPLKSVVDSWFMVEFLVTIDYELVSVQWKGGRIFALCVPWRGRYECGLQQSCAPYFCVGPVLASLNSEGCNLVHCKL